MKRVEFPRSSFELLEDYKNDRKFGLLHVNETYPKKRGHYRAVFEDKKGVYYINEKRLFVCEAAQMPFRRETGGIYISHDKKAYLSYILSNGRVDTSAFGIPPGTQGAAGALVLRINSGERDPSSS